MPQLELTGAGFDKRGAAVDPVAVIAVEHAADVGHLGPMDMAADDAVQAAPTRGVRGSRLEAVHVAHRIADATLEVSGQRPVAVTKTMPQRVECAVHSQHD